VASATPEIAQRFTGGDHETSEECAAGMPEVALRRSSADHRRSLRTPGTRG